MLSTYNLLMSSCTSTFHTLPLQESAEQWSDKSSSKLKNHRAEMLFIWTRWVLIKNFIAYLIYRGEYKSNTVYMLCKAAVKLGFHFCGTFLPSFMAAFFLKYLNWKILSLVKLENSSQSYSSSSRMALHHCFMTLCCLDTKRSYPALVQSRYRWV